MGMLKHARLFRAAARSESSHKENHKEAILDLGGKVKNFKPDEIKADTTAENLQAAIKGESYERDTMYPQFGSALFPGAEIIDRLLGTNDS